MPDPAIVRLHGWLEDHEQELIERTRQMLRVPSVKEPPEDGAPYGRPCREALDLALAMGREYGFRTADLDHKVGYAEFGQGPLIVSLGHLDVVPTGPGWKHDPFGAEIADGYLYARGAEDDKGPTMASFFAARAIRECLPDLGARIRIVFGCDEESGMTCVERYVQTEEIPTFGIAPDSMWPLVHAEKGICDLFVLVPDPGGPLRLLSLDGGQRLNIVIDSCSARVQVAPDARAHVESKLADSWDRNVSFRWEDQGVLAVEAAGKAAHGSTPWRGDSAAVRVFRFLAEIAPLESQPFYEALLQMGHPSGVGLGIHGRDDVSRDLTSNLGVVGLQDGAVRLSVNVRYPVTWKGGEVRARAESWFRQSPVHPVLSEFRDSPSLYFPLEHPLVETIVAAYRDETGDDKPPGVMGGGTYARKIPNTVSVGTGWLGDGEAHQTDERIKVSHLLRMAKIYARILHDLALRASRA